MHCTVFRKQAFYFVAIITLLFSLGGCAAWDSAVQFTDSLLGDDDNSEPPKELVDYEPEIKIVELWKEDIGDGYEDHVINLQPAIDTEYVFAADREGVVEARSLADGEEIWEQETGFIFSSGPGLSTDKIILGTSNAEVVAIAKHNAEILWVRRVSSEILSVPVVTNNIVIVRTTDGKVFALDEYNGDELWAFERNIPSLSIRGAGTPLLYEDMLINGYSNGKTIALRLQDGKQLWETSVAIPQGRSEVERLVDLIVDPVVSGDIVYISAFQGGTSALLAEDGEVLWRNTELSSSAGMSIDGSYLYLTDVQSDVWQMDKRNGASLWKQKELHRRELTAPVAYQDFVLVADLEGYVHWLSMADGRQMAREQISDSPVIVRPQIVGDVVYVYAKDGTLAAYRAQALE